MSLEKWKRVPKLIRVALREYQSLKAYNGLAAPKTALMRANLLLGQVPMTDPNYPTWKDTFDRAMILLHQARWYATEAGKTRDKESWKKANRRFSQSEEIAEALRESLEKGIPTETNTYSPSIHHGDAEILFADDVPLVPSIQPVVILQGSNFQMGYQYAEQLVDIFGTWILKRKANRRFQPDEIEMIRKWEEQIREHTPEIIEFCEGWVEGAATRGVPMSYLDVLALWTGTLPPEEDYMGSGGQRMMTIPPLACSGVAAWGRATRDGELVTGSTGDFDVTHSVTIVAYPEDGNAFIFTPFGATGDVPLIGGVHFFGHPGMNNKGLAYVHHGGTPKMIEPKSSWGYGVRRAAGVMHILRFAETAKEALEMELAFPVGDVGLDSGTVGGFFADSEYGFVLESRYEPILMRESGTIGETDFLYSANSPLHPEVRDHGWMKEEQEKWEWSGEGGWRPKKFSFFHKLGMVYFGSSQRSQYFANMLQKYSPEIDIEVMKEIYRTGGTIPPGDWKQNAKTWRKTGEWGATSAGNASNGITVVMKPSEGYYAVCVGQAKRGLAPTAPFFASYNPIFDETNQFWELELGDSPLETAENCRERARDLLAKIVGDIKNPLLMELRQLAESEWETGNAKMPTQVQGSNSQDLRDLSKANRHFLRSQVRSLQVLESMVVEMGEKKVPIMVERS